MRKHLAVLGLFALSLLAAPLRADQAPAAAGDTLSMDPADSTLVYEIVHKLHAFKGTSKKATGKGRILPDGKAQVMVTVPVDTFDSGNGNRDAHMKETVEAARFPTVELKAVGEGVLPASFPGTVRKTFRGELNFHGVKKQVELPLTLAFESPSKVRVTGKFSIKLEEFKVERPSLMFVKIDEDCKFDVNVVFKK